MLRQRGPDYQGQHTVSSEAAELEFRGNVLWQQGDTACKQPVVNDKHVMLLNGDIYNRPANSISLSDTKWMFNQLILFDKVEVN